MNIVVCIKQVPDSAASLVAEGGSVSWGDAPLVLNPWDEYAVETALQVVESHGGEVTVVSVGGESTREAIKTALAMGCSGALLISDPALKVADSLVISHVLAAAILKLGKVDLAFFGKQAIDSDMGVTAPQTSRILGWPILSLVSRIRGIDSDANTITVERSIEEGRQIVESRLPAVVTVSKDIAEPRYPSFMGIRKAAKAEIPIWTLEDLRADITKPAVFWPELINPPRREVTTEIITGDSPEQIAEKLVDRILEEKVI